MKSPQPAKKRRVWKWRYRLGAKERAALLELARLHGEDGAIMRAKVSPLAFYRAAAGFPINDNQHRRLWDAMRTLLVPVDARQLAMPFPTTKEVQ